MLLVDAAAVVQFLLLVRIGSRASRWKARPRRPCIRLPMLGGQSEAEARRSEAGASIAGSGSLSALQSEEVVVSSADFVRWSGQVES